MLTVPFNYAELARRVKAALREEFPEDTIAVSEGYQGRVRVKLVSERFNGMSEREKQDIIWELVRTHLGSDSEGVSIILAYGTDEL